MPPNLCNWQSTRPAKALPRGKLRSAAPSPAMEKSWLSNITRCWRQRTSRHTPKSTHCELRATQRMTFISKAPSLPRLANLVRCAWPHCIGRTWTRSTSARAFKMRKRRVSGNCESQQRTYWTTAGARSPSSHTLAKTLAASCFKRGSANLTNAAINASCIAEQTIHVALRHDGRCRTNAL